MIIKMHTGKTCHNKMRCCQSQAYFLTESWWKSLPDWIFKSMTFYRLQISSRCSQFWIFESIVPFRHSMHRPTLGTNSVNYSEHEIGHRISIPGCSGAPVFDFFPSQNQTRKILMCLWIVCCVYGLKNLKYLLIVCKYCVCVCLGVVEREITLKDWGSWECRPAYKLVWLIHQQVPELDEDLKSESFLKVLSRFCLQRNKNSVQLGQIDYL